MATLTKKWSNQQMAFEILFNDRVLFTVEDNNLLKYIGERLMELSESEGNESLTV